MRSNLDFASISDRLGEFGSAHREHQARMFGRNLLVATALYMAYVAWDVVVSPETVKDVFTVRLGIGLFCLSLFAASRFKGFVKWHEFWYIALISVAGVSVAVILGMTPAGFEIGIAGVVICIAASSALFEASAIATVTAGALATLGTILLMVRAGLPEPIVRGHSIFLVTAVGFAVLNNVQRRRIAYDVFKTQHRLASEKDRTEGLLRDITVMREERLTWLENLATFLRHELRNQIVAVGSSIDLAQGTGSAESRGTYLERAQTSLTRMRALVSSATEATSLESALAADQTLPVNWSAVVVERVLSFERAGLEAHFDLRLKPGIWVQGNEERLVQLLDKLLNNAIEHTRGSEEILVQLTHTENGDAELVVENRGDSLPEDRERIFDAFVTSQKSRENLGLGLFVARSIARNHGGDVLAERLHGEIGARFTVRLPVVASVSGPKAVELEALQQDRVIDWGE